MTEQADPMSESGTGLPDEQTARPDLAAARTWNLDRSLEETTAAIHDGVHSEEDLQLRARGYVEGCLFGNFPQSIPQRDATILEIGSGLGWIMQTVNEHLTCLSRPPRRIIGLDIAPNMIAMAKRRLGDSGAFDFLLYDGISIPLPDASLDLIYSVASLQHVPRPFVFNLFFEIRRLLKPGAYALLHFTSTDWLPRQEKLHAWRQEIKDQVSGAATHWHHYYTAKELQDVLAITGFRYVVVKDDRAGMLVCCVSDAAPKGAAFNILGRFLRFVGSPFRPGRTNS